ncbi:hypothetical protein STANM309S_04496 [Streptomyces tanashiensis]
MVAGPSRDEPATTPGSPVGRAPTASGHGIQEEPGVGVFRCFQDPRGRARLHDLAKTVGAMLGSRWRTQTVQPDQPCTR